MEAVRHAGFLYQFLPGAQEHQALRVEGMDPRDVARAKTVAGIDGLTVSAIKEFIRFYCWVPVAGRRMPFAV